MPWLKLRPRANRNAFAKPRDYCLRVCITAPPVGGGFIGLMCRGLCGSTADCGKCGMALLAQPGQPYTRYPVVIGSQLLGHANINSGGRTRIQKLPEWSAATCQK